MLQSPAPIRPNAPAAASQTSPRVSPQGGLSSSAGAAADGVQPKAVPSPMRTPQIQRSFFVSPKPVVSIENYQSVARQLSLEFLATADSSEDWKLVDSSGGVRIEKRAYANTSIECFRGTAVIAVPPSFVYEVVCEPNIQKLMDKDLMVRGVLRSFDADHEICYYQYRCPYPVWHRDFVTMEVSQQLGNDAFATFGRSIVDTEVSPPATDFVRGEVLCSGYYIRPNPRFPDQSLVSFVAQADPCGWMPAAIVNMASKDQPMVVARLRDLVLQRWKEKIQAQSTAKK